MELFLALILLTAFPVSLQTETNDCSAGQVLVPNRVAIPDSYDRHEIPPANVGENASQVRIGFVVNDILDVDDQDYTVTIKVSSLYWCFRMFQMLFLFRLIDIGLS